MNAAAEFGHRVVRGQGHQYADAPAYTRDSKPQINTGK
jgi:hypothetical protein